VLVTLFNDLAQMYSTMRRCAKRLFDQCHFKVKVIVWSQTHYCVRSISFELYTNVKYDESICSAYVLPTLVQGQGHRSILNIVWLRPFTKFNISNYHFYKPTPFSCCGVFMLWYLSLTGIAVVYDPIFL